MPQQATWNSRLCLRGGRRLAARRPPGCSGGVHSRGKYGKIAYPHVYRLSFYNQLAGELSPLECSPPGKGSEQRTSLLHHMARWYPFRRAGEGVPPTMDKGSSTNALTLRETPMQSGSWGRLRGTLEGTFDTTITWDNRWTLSENQAVEPRHIFRSMTKDHYRHGHDKYA
jgi:hypothetical protein